VLGPSPLTERERMVFRLLACSTSHDVVAAQLGISARTVHNYAVAVRGKLVFATAIVLQVFLV
jgi:DNA-binding NarL/FixJ family response regulator